MHSAYELTVISVDIFYCSLLRSNYHYKQRLRLKLTGGIPDRNHDYEFTLFINAEQCGIVADKKAADIPDRHKRQSSSLGSGEA